MDRVMLKLEVGQIWQWTNSDDQLVVYEISNITERTNNASIDVTVLKSNSEEFHEGLFIKDWVDSATILKFDKYVKAYNTPLWRCLNG